MPSRLRGPPATDNSVIEAAAATIALANATGMWCPLFELTNPLPGEKSHAVDWREVNRQLRALARLPP